jgi:4,5-dihydroxyphthalate decarboxylase
MVNASDTGNFVPDAAHPGRSVLQLSMALSDNPRTRPLIEGRVSPEGIRLISTTVHPSEMFWRQLRYGDFDVSEMSMSTLTILTSKGNRDWVGLPVYTMRKFFHTEMIARRDAGIATPADLKGKRVGVPEYQQTAAIWTRGVLQHEFGVAPQDMRWFMERNDDKSHGASTGFKAPPGVLIERIPTSTNAGEMLAKGELDAMVRYTAHKNLVDRSRLDLKTDPAIRYLFEDREAESARYYKKTGIYPINHIVVIKRAVYEKHPWIALNLYSAFQDAMDEVRKDSLAWLGPYYDTGLVDKAVKRTLATGPMPYGLKAGRHVLETVTRYVHEQGLCERRVDLDEIFAPNTLDL